MENLIISKDIGRTAVEKSVGKKENFSSGQMADSIQSWTDGRLQYLQRTIERKRGFWRDENV